MQFNFNLIYLLLPININANVTKDVYRMHTIFNQKPNALLKTIYKYQVEECKS